jgi:hypothetical protein
VGFWRKKGLDYLFSIFPVCIIFGTVWLEYLFGKYVKGEKRRILVTGLIFLPSVIFGLYRTILFMGGDTRAETSDWLVQHNTAGMKFCYDTYHYDLGVFDVDRYLRYGAGSGYLPADVKEELERYRGDRKNISLVPVLYSGVGPVRPGSGLYEREQAAYKRKTIDQLLSEGADYLITTDAFYSIYREARPEQYKGIIAERIREVQNFYGQLESQLQPIAVFSPTLWKKGPEIKIYDLHMIHMKPDANE